MSGVKRDSDAVASYVARILSRAEELHESDAFAPATRPDPGVVSASRALAEASSERKASRRWVIAFAVFCLAAVAFLLCLPYGGFDTMGAGGEIYAPGDVLDCYKLWFQRNIMPLFDSTLYNRRGRMLEEFNAAHPDVSYSQVMNRAVATAIIVAAGMMLALAGLLFQSAFRNPMAAPTSLGVADGVQAGCIVYIALGNVGIADNPALYAVMVYAGGALCVIAVLLLSRAMSGGARYNVLDMLLLGTVICQLVGGVSAYAENFVFDETQWYNYYDVQQADTALETPLLQRVFIVTFVIAMVPAFVLRFKLNLITFSNDEATMMGSRAGVLRGLALVLGSVMELGAIATIGQVAMLSLAVPFVVRYMMPADFKSQFLGNCLVGTAVLLVCFAIQHFATLGIITMPVGTIVSLFIVPFFVWMVAFGKGRW